METSWTDCILFTSRSEEKSPRLFLDCSGSGSVGVRRRNRLAPEPSLPLSLLPSLPPTAAAKAPSPFQPGLRLGPIILSGLSFGISISKCPQFLVTQTLVAVCFSTYHPGKLRIRPLRADPRLVFHPRCPISIGSDHSASIEVSLALCGTIVCFWASFCAWSRGRSTPGVHLTEPSCYPEALDAWSTRVGFSGSHLSSSPKCPWRVPNTPQLYLFPGCIVPALDSQPRGGANSQLQFPFWPSCFSHKQICEKRSFGFF